MNEDILRGKWKQMHGDVKKWWGKLTDDDIQRIQGSQEKLAGVLQERYGYNRQVAQEKIAEFLEDAEAKLRTRQNQ